MTSRTVLRRALFAAALAVFAAAARPAAFAAGESIFGEPGRADSAQRVVDVSSVNRLNVSYGETVMFTNGHEQFSWTFDGLDRRSLDLANIAPAYFAAGPFTIYIGMDPLKYN